MHLKKLKNFLCYLKDVVNTQLKFQTGMNAMVAQRNLLHLIIQPNHTKLLMEHGTAHQNAIHLHDGILL